MRFSPVFTLEVHNALRKEVEGSAKAMRRAVHSHRSARHPCPRGQEPRVPYLRANAAEGDSRRRDGVGRCHLAGRRPEQRLVLRLCRRFDERLSSLRTIRPSMPPPRAKTGTEPFREIRTKVLKINFWRPGDEFTVRESQVRDGRSRVAGRPAVEAVLASGFGGKPSRRRKRPFRRAQVELNGMR